MHLKTVTSQLQRFHHKSQNNKRKHKDCLAPKCITPIEMASNLIAQNTEDTNEYKPPGKISKHSISMPLDEPNK